MPSEADISHLFEPLLQKGWKIFLPRFAGNNFEFRNIETPDALRPGKYGILEPYEEAELLTDESITIALLPGLAFDPMGNRLGRGNGGYDKWLDSAKKKNPDMKVWGTALDCQMVNVVPSEPHDRKMDLVITPRGVVTPPNS